MPHTGVDPGIHRLDETSARAVPVHHFDSSRDTWLLAWLRRGWLNQTAVSWKFGLAVNCQN